MKKMFIVVSLFCIGLLTVSCNGRNAKKAVEYGKKAVSEYRALSESDGIRYLKTQRKAKQLQNVYNQVSVCPDCHGYGVVYYYNEYGIITDMYGNPQPYVCPKCGGSGQRW